MNFHSIRIIPFDFVHPWTPARMIGKLSRLGNLLEKIPVLREIAGSLYIAAIK